MPKIESEIFELCEKLHKEKIYTKAHVFANTMLKQKTNPRAILHALTRCYIKAQAQPFEDHHKAPWGYCLQVLKVENGNYNEADYRKDKS